MDSVGLVQTGTGACVCGSFGAEQTTGNDVKWVPFHTKLRNFDPPPPCFTKRLKIGHYH